MEAVVIEKQPIYDKINKTFDEFTRDNIGFIKELLLSGFPVLLGLGACDGGIVANTGIKSYTIAGTSDILNAPYDVRYLILLTFRSHVEVIFMDENFGKVNTIQYVK
jgi:hypothetical protein